MSKSRGRKEKLRQKKAERRKTKKLGNMKNPVFLWGFSWPILTIKLGKIEIFDQKVPTSWGLPHILFFSVWGRGEGRSCPRRWPRGLALIENRGRGAGIEEGVGGGEERGGGLSVRKGEGLSILFWDRNSP